MTPEFLAGMAHAAAIVDRMGNDLRREAFSACVRDGKLTEMPKTDRHPRHPLMEAILLAGLYVGAAQSIRDAMNGDEAA